MAATETEQADAESRPDTRFDSESAREAARRSAESRRAKAAAREQTAEENALTFRQRLGVSLSKLSQQELDKRVKEAKPHELVRFADQAFGKPTEAEPDTPKDEGLAALTRDQRGALRAMLEQDEANPLDVSESRTEDEPGP